MRNGRMRRIVELLKWKKPGDILGGGIEPMRTASGHSPRIAESKRHDLRKTIKRVYAALHTLGLRIAQDKTYFGRVSKGFDFLGFHCCPTGMTVSAAALSRRDQKIARLYEQGASKERVGAYLRRWIGWAGVGFVVLALCNSAVGGGNDMYISCGGNERYMFWLDAGVKNRTPEWMCGRPNKETKWISGDIWGGVYVWLHCGEPGEEVINMIAGVECKEKADGWDEVDCYYKNGVEFCEHHVKLDSLGNVRMNYFFKKNLNVNCGSKLSCMIVDTDGVEIDKYYRSKVEEYWEIINKIRKNEYVKPDEKLRVKDIGVGPRDPSDFQGK